MKYIKLFENFEPHDPYELMIVSPNKKSEMIMRECEKDEPNLNLVSDLIVLGANLDWQDEDYNMTVMHMAAWFGRVEIARMLIDAGANLDIQDIFGKTILHVAMEGNYSEITQMLIDAGAKLDIQDRDGETVLHWAAWRNYSEITQMLIDAGVKLNIQDKWDRTALHWAVDNNSPETAQMLIYAGARKDIPDNDGEIPYDLAGTQELKNLLKP
jgi:ankyrin repeat protein